MSSQEIQAQIIENFSMLESKNDQYQYIIELGKELETLPEQFRSDQYLIKGCQSKVWLGAAFEDGKITFWADSDSSLVKGLVSLLVQVFTQKTPTEILATDLFFMDKIGLQAMLSMNRSNGLASMVKQIHYYALAYKN